MGDKAERTQTAKERALELEEYRLSVDRWPDDHLEHLIGMERRDKHGDGEKRAICEALLRYRHGENTLPDGPFR